MEQGLYLSQGRGRIVLTNIFYFGHYRDFALRASSGSNSNFNRSLLNRAQIQTMHRAEGTSAVQLNKTLDNRILHFAKALGENVLILKDSARMFANNMQSLDIAASVGNTYNQLQWIEEDLRSFALSYNNLNYIHQATGHSQNLSHLTHSIRNVTQGNETLLSHLGIVVADAGGLTYHGIGNTASREITQQAAMALKNAYDAARDFLSHPMSHHMEFKNLNYYYNYTIGNTPNDTFRLLESGILIDIAI